MLYKGVYYVDLGESFHMSIYLRTLASIQPRMSLVKFARSPCTDYYYRSTDRPGNLSLVRCTNLQELVYKQGQAGIVKASVTIRFNNSDPKMRPPGYEMEKIDVTREIIVGGKNKYKINSHVVQQNQVQNLSAGCRSIAVLLERSLSLTDGVGDKLRPLP